jgi:hypothetical protein
LSADAPPFKSQTLRKVRQRLLAHPYIQLFDSLDAMAALRPEAQATALVIIGVAALTFSNAINSLMQLSTEPAMRGRVMALRVGVALGSTRSARRS